jgi:hypothetical protein
MLRGWVESESKYFAMIAAPWLRYQMPPSNVVVFFVPFLEFSHHILRIVYRIVFFSSILFVACQKFLLAKIRGFVFEITLEVKQFVIIQLSYSSSVLTIPMVVNLAEL